MHNGMDFDTGSFGFVLSAHDATAYLVADQIGSKLVCTHRHLQGLVVLCRNIYVAHKHAEAQKR
jgi:hypothetical protein